VIEGLAAGGNARNIALNQSPLMALNGPPTVLVDVCLST
jgi:uncharacterized membrane protein YeiH